MKKAYLQKKYKQYISSNILHLSQCYKTYSRDKEIAWVFCKYLVRKYKGWNLKVISYNRYCFTAGFLYYEGLELKFMYITKNFHNSISMDLGELNFTYISKDSHDIN